MSQLYFGQGIPVASGFDLSAHKPLDARSVVSTIADRDSIPAIQLYKGLIVFVEAESKYFMLVNYDADYSNPKWEELGSGSLSFEKFTVVDGKVVEAEKPGQVIYITVGDEAYPAGPYIVTAAGTVSSLTSAPVGSDVATEVATLQGKVSTIEDTVTALGTKDTELEAADAALGQRINGVEATLSGKAAQGDVDALAGRVSANETAIATKAENSAVEALEGKVTANETAIAGKAAQGDVDALESRMDTAEGAIETLEDKVDALSSATHFIGVKGSLDEVTDPKAGDIVIVGNKEYVYDEQKSWVELGDTTEESGRISTLEGKVSANEGAISTLEGKVSANESAIATKAENSAVESLEGRVSANETAIAGKAAQSDVDALAGRVSANETAIAGKAAQGDLDSAVARIESVEGAVATKAESSAVEAIDERLKSAESTIVVLGTDVEGLKTSVDGHGTKISGLEASVADLKVKNAVTTASHGVSLSLSEQGVLGVNVNIDDLASEVIEKHQVSSSTIKLGANIGTETTPDRYTTNDSVQGVLESMNARIESIDADIQSALEGGVTGIEQGNGIVVDSTTATKPKVSVKVADTKSGLSLTTSGLAVSVVEGSAIKVTDEGLDLQWSQF